MLSASSGVSNGTSARASRTPLPGVPIDLAARHSRVATSSDNRLVFRIHPMAGVKALHAGELVCTAIMAFLSLTVDLWG